MNDFEHLYNQHFDYVYRYVLFRLGNRQVAEDVTSQTFFTALKHQDQYDPEKGSWQQWITGIAKYRLLDYWQKEKVILSLEEVQQAENFFFSLPDSIKQLDQKMLFKSIIQNLSKNLRRLLILRYVDDLTYEEIAKITGKTSVAVRKAFSRLHQHLKAQFESDELNS